MKQREGKKKEEERTVPLDLVQQSHYIKEVNQIKKILFFSQNCR